jgi:hypothetical protein
MFVMFGAMSEFAYGIWAAFCDKGEDACITFVALFLLIPSSDSGSMGKGVLCLGALTVVR